MSCVLVGFAAAAASPATQIAQVEGLIARVWSADSVPLFTLNIPDSAFTSDSHYPSAPGASTSNDWFTVADGPGGTVALTGTSGVALATAFHWYLRNRCNQSVSWYASSNTPLASLPPVGAPVNRSASVYFRYYMNVCTVSYSSAYWDWPRWEWELDWAAMHGVNLPLAFTGQEAVWADVWRSIGVRDDELAGFFAGSAFLAWGRMGNLQGWGGPLANDWMEAQAALQVRILARARGFGMRAVLPAFAGFVPDAIPKRLFPNASVRPAHVWNGFKPPYSGVQLLDPQDPLFLRIGVAFIRAQTARYGTDSIYNCDTFNEMDPASSDPAYLAATSAAVYGSMVRADPNALWVMQGWLFHSGFWNDATMRAYLSGVPDDKMVVLDLDCEDSPVWRRIIAVSGKTFVWNALLSYGGRRALFGNLQVLTAGQVADHQAAGSRMVGVGITPEAIENNAVAYDAVFDTVWEPAAPPPAVYARDHARARYGGTTAADAAWAQLVEVVYSGQATQRLSPIAHTPRLTVEPQQYSSAALIPAARGLVAAAASTPPNGLMGLRYDIVDVTRQVLADISCDIVTLFSAGYQRCLNSATRYPLARSLWPLSPTSPPRPEGAVRCLVPECGGEVDVAEVARRCGEAPDCGGFTDDGWLLPPHLVASPPPSAGAAAGVAWRGKSLEFPPGGCAAQGTMDGLGMGMLDLIGRLDAVLATTSGYLVGEWIAAARAMGTSAAERDQLEYNARNQITLWGPNGEIVDYASKEWAGLTATHFARRWSIFFQRFANLSGPADLGPSLAAAFLAEGRAWDAQTAATQPFPSTPVGPTAEDAAAAALDEWAPPTVPLPYRWLPDLSAAGAPGAVKVWTTDAGVMSRLCDFDPWCTAFSTDGWVVSGSPAPSGAAMKGVRLYTRGECKGEGGCPVRRA